MSINGRSAPPWVSSQGVHIGCGAEGGTFGGDQYRRDRVDQRWLLTWRRPSQSHSRFALQSARSGQASTVADSQTLLFEERAQSVLREVSAQIRRDVATFAGAALGGQGGTLASATNGSNQAGEAREDSGAVVGGCAA